MATPVLPYPDMDFTPLDILTAAEMDQMVANDQYLRDFCAGLADGTNLSDGVIQARKIDWSTFDQFSPEQTGTRCSVRVASFGKVAIIVGTTTAFTYSGTYSAQSFILPAGIVPSGSLALGVFMDTFSHTVDDNQITHGSAPFTFGSTAQTIAVALLAGNTNSKSCKVEFIIPVLLP